MRNVYLSIYLLTVLAEREKQVARRGQLRRLTMPRRGIQTGGSDHKITE